jgi:hypothetical protein
MALAPDATAETIPGYFFDSATGHYYRIGVGEHVHQDYLPLIGGTIAPGPLIVPAPASLSSAARWADGVPRFADVVARDAAYATLPGGAQEGMKCRVLGTVNKDFTYLTGAWVYAVSGLYTRNTDVSLTANVPYVALLETATAVGPDVVLPALSAGQIVIPHSGIYTFEAWAVLSSGAAAAVNVEGRVNGAISGNSALSLGAGSATVPTTMSKPLVAGDLVTMRVTTSAARTMTGAVLNLTSIQL